MVDFDNVISNLNKPKSREEYEYIFDHYFIFNSNELKTILSTFINNFNFDIYPEFVESYDEVVDYLKHLEKE